MFSRLNGYLGKVGGRGHTIARSIESIGRPSPASEEGERHPVNYLPPSNPFSVHTQLNTVNNRRLHARPRHPLVLWLTGSSQLPLYSRRLDGRPLVRRLGSLN